jgi:hypothetical protein
MLPREEGGVVDPDLVVYGTTNLRIVRRALVPFFILWNHCLPTLTATGGRVYTSYPYQCPSDGGQFLGLSYLRMGMNPHMHMVRPCTPSQKRCVAST